MFGLDSEIAVRRDLAHGVAELSAEEHQRKFAGVDDRTDPWLDHHAPTADLLRKRVALAQSKGCIGTGGDRRFDDKLGAVKPLARLAESDFAKTIDGDRRYGRNSFAAE